MITPNDVVQLTLTLDELTRCVDNAKILTQSVIDRKDLHPRDDLERFNNILMGEVAECMVIRWLQNNGKYVESTVDKSSGTPDVGHDLKLLATDGRAIKCSIKSSLSYKKRVPDIINEFKLATTRDELRDVNIQVYFWLELNPPRGISRCTVASLQNSAIIGWFGRKDLTEFAPYNHEARESPAQSLRLARKMSDLLPLLKYYSGNFIMG